MIIKEEIKKEKLRKTVNSSLENKIKFLEEILYCKLDMVKMNESILDEIIMENFDCFYEELNRRIRDPAAVSLALKKVTRILREENKKIRKENEK